MIFLSLDALELAGLAMWVVVVVVHFAFTGVVARASRAPELEGHELARKYLLGIAGFFLLHGACRVPYIVYDYFAVGDEAWWLLGAVVGFFSIVWLMYFVESAIIPKTRHAFTAFGLVGTVLIVATGIADIATSKLVQGVFIPVLAVVVPLFYAYAAFKSTGEVRRDSAVTTLGAVAFILAEMAHTSIAREISPLIYASSPLLMLAGLVLFYFGTIRVFGKHATGR
ncbi:MAG: hypothetical protein ACTSU5_09670 [Promethearchaeota archaeon]